MGEVCARRFCLTASSIWTACFRGHFVDAPHRLRNDLLRNALQAA